jgi:hypothetical protein
LRGGRPAAEEHLLQTIGVEQDSLIAVLIAVGTGVGDQGRNPVLGRHVRQPELLAVGALRGRRHLGQVLRVRYRSVPSTKLALKMMPAP